MVNKKNTISKASKGYIKDYYNTTNNKSQGALAQFGLTPVFDRTKALEAIRKDATVLSAITTLVDKSMENGYRCKAKDSKSKDKNFKQKLKDLRFDILLRQMFYNLYAYNNAFIEIVKDANKSTKELHILETTMTEPVATKHGKVTHYLQNVAGENPIEWAPDKITHIPVTKLTTSIWGELDIEAIYTKVLIKQYIDNYLGWLFGTNQFKGFYNIEEAQEGQVKEFISWLKKSEVNINLPIVAEGDITYQILRDFSDGDSILRVKESCDNDILTLFQVPPVMMGKPGDSNRSNSDSQESSLATRVKSIHKLVEDYCEYDLFPKMGYTKNFIEFNPIVKSSIGKMLEYAERMINMGMKSDKVEEYLKSEGFPLVGKLFKTPEEIAAAAELLQPKEDTGSPGNKKSQDMQPSRKGKEEGTANKKIGVGSASTTRENQIHKSYDEYPYIYTPEVQK